MKRPRGSRSAPVRVHSSLEPETFQRLQQLAKRERSSLSRLIKLAVLAFLDESEPQKFEPSRLQGRS
jgi:predicted transcriptional regulator